jgi:dTDP-4-amino-4,6-dideoxygalactose transaminase
VQLAKLEAGNARRNQLLGRYRERLSEVPGISMPYAGRSGVAHIAVGLVDELEHRDALRESLRQDGIQTSLHYPPIHLFSHYRDAYGTGPGDLPVAEDLTARAMTLPLYASMPEEHVDLVCDSIASFLSARTGAGHAS